MRILQRHLLASLLVPTSVCLFAVTLMWVVYDLLDNYNDFIEAGASGGQVLTFYLTSLPQALDAVLPLALLAGTLYTLANFSRTQQFTAMQACGVSVWQMARPFLLVAVVFSAVHAWLHVKLTPQAARERESQMVRLRAMREKDGRKAEALQEKSALLHHNPADRRMWFIGRADLRGRVLSDVEILQTAPNGRDRTKTYAKTMRPVDGGWELVDGLVLNYDEAGDAVSRETFERRVDAGLGERFDRVTGGAPKAESLGMAELRKAIADPPRSGAAHVAPFRTYLAFRWTAGLTCVATVLACVALGIGNSRRNLFVGMSRALGLFVGFFALGKLCLALGQGARIPAWLGGAGPSVAFLLIGLGLLWLRGSRIELRGPWQWWCDRAAERGV